MTVPTSHHAELARAAYQTYPPDAWEEGVDIDGVRYSIIDQRSTASGYQGILFQRSDTGEMVVAHRGTEFDRELVKDGVLTDVGMVLTGRNLQSRDANEFTRDALDLARDRNADRCSIPAITVTGHSLGGTLAQITAHRLGLRAETFNAYGAAGLTADYPRTDPDIVNHAKATDFVSAASPHIGEVRVYATQRDVDALARNGYGGTPRAGRDDVLGLALAEGIPAHYSENFSTTNPAGPLVAEANAERAREHASAIADYRGDVARIHGVLAAPRNAVDHVADLVARVTGRPAPDPAPPSAFDAGACALPPMAPATRLPADPRAGPLYRDAEAGVHRLEAALGRTPDATTDRLTASVYRHAAEAGLARIDEVVLSRATPTAPAGASVFAVEGSLGDPRSRHVQIATGDALATPVETSLRAADAAVAMRAAREPIEPERQAVLAR